MEINVFTSSDLLIIFMLFCFLNGGSAVIKYKEQLERIYKNYRYFDSVLKSKNVFMNRMLRIIYEYEGEEIKTKYRDYFHSNIEKHEERIISKAIDTIIQEKVKKNTDDWVREKLDILKNMK